MYKPTIEVCLNAFNVELDSKSIEKNTAHLDVGTLELGGASENDAKEEDDNRVNDELNCGKDNSIVNLPALTFSKEDQLNISLSTRMKKWF